MSFRALASLLVGWFAVLVVACASVRFHASLRDVSGDLITSAWKNGAVVTRVVNGKLVDASLVGIKNVDEKVVAEAPLMVSPEIVFALSVVAGRDGVKATLGDQTAYVTPDDMLAHEGYDHGFSIPALSLSIGANVPLIEALLADALKVTVPDLLARADFTRFRVVRSGNAPEPFAATTPLAVTPELLRGAALDAARFLARGLASDGRFRYMVDATNNHSLPGYDWPRHAGATYFLAQAADLSHDPALRAAALRAAGYLRDHSTVECGTLRCIGQDNVVDVGSSALGLLAMTEIVRTGLDAGYRLQVDQLSAFLRSQQRKDGEFMHQFDRRAKLPIDVQYLYYSGEATLALARAYTLTHDPLDLAAASRGLAHIVGPAWSFFGDRYYFGEEHWTCQALSELWEAAPDRNALSFCTRWQAYGRNMMFGPGETPYDADGAYGAGPIVTPRYTPVASRCEAGVATLDAMTRAGSDPNEREALAMQLRRSLALLLRQQFRPGLTHLFADPGAVLGAFPGSSVDWQLRIDYAQHAGSAMIRAASSDLFKAP